MFYVGVPPCYSFCSAEQIQFCKSLKSVFLLELLRVVSCLVHTYPHHVPFPSLYSIQTSQGVPFSKYHHPCPPSGRMPPELLAKLLLYLCSIVPPPCLSSWMPTIFPAACVAQPLSSNICSSHSNQVTWAQVLQTDVLPQALPRQTHILKHCYYRFDFFIRQEQFIYTTCLYIFLVFVASSIQGFAMTCIASTIYISCFQLCLWGTTVGLWIPWLRVWEQRLTLKIRRE